MQTLSGKSGSISYGETSWEVGNSRDSIERDELNSAIEKANTVPLSKIFQYYGLNLNEHNRRTTCPLSKHQGGRERTPSFSYYPDTNTYYCFGCKSGSLPTDFVCQMDGISRKKASLKIIEIFHADVDDFVIYNRESFDERLEIMMKFSNLVRDFKKSNLSEESIKFINNVCQAYDTVNSKHQLSNDALREVVENLLIKAIDYRKLNEKRSNYR